MATLIKQIDTGKRYLQILSDGTTRISRNQQTEAPTLLDPETSWVVAEKGDSQEYSGPAVAADIVSIPDGSKVEIFTDYELFYATVQSLAIPFELGLILAKYDLVSYNDKIYRVRQPHTVVDYSHTPDIVPALYIEIPAPASSGYPVWGGPFGGPYNIGSIVQWPEGGQLWRSTINANTTEPGTLLPWGYWVVYDE